MHKHRDIVARFGRFPYRNAALGRTNTVEEAAFLVNGPVSASDAFRASGGVATELTNGTTHPADLESKP